MIEKIKIENYKNFKSFEFDGFKRVNLIAGKNNVGKTNLLEAIYLTENEFRPISFASLFQLRTNNPEYKKVVSTTADLNLFLENSIKSIQRIDQHKLPSKVQIEINQDSKYSLTQINYSENTEKNVSGEFKPVLTPKFDQEFDPKDSKFCFLIDSKIARFVKYPGYDQKDLFQMEFKPIVGFVGANGTHLDPLLYVMEQIKQEGQFEYLIAKISDLLETDISDIYPFRIENSLFSEIKFSTESSKGWHSFSSLGFGSNRIIFQLLSIFVSQGKSLVIDEIDLGIHYSKQEEFWKLIFSISKDLNVQIFATTHSRDCFDAFARVANYDENKGSGKFIRLSDKSGVLKAIDYEDQDIEAAEESGVEVR